MPTINHLTNPSLQAGVYQPQYPPGFSPPSGLKPANESVHAAPMLKHRVNMNSHLVRRMLFFFYSSEDLLIF